MPGQKYITRTLRQSLLLLAICSCSITSQADTHNRDISQYRLGIFPYMAHRQTIRFYGPVAAGMTQALKREVKLESQPSFSDFTRAMGRKVYDIALIQPFDYPRIVDEFGYIPITQLSVPLVSQIYVRSDSQYKNIYDLKGTTIAMPPAQAANSRMNMRALKDNNLIPGRNINVRFFNSHDSCIQQVWVGNASACGTAVPPIKIFEQRMKASLRAIHSTPSVPHILFVVHPRVAVKDREKLANYIINWKNNDKGRALLKNLGFPGFVKAKPAEYKVMSSYESPRPVVSVKNYQQKKELTLGIFPYLSSRQLIKKFALVVPALAKSINKPFHIRSASNFGSFMDKVATSTYDVIMVQPFEYKKAIQSGYVPLAGMKNPLQAVFFVKQDSPYQKVSQLKNQNISMPPADAAMSRLGRHALVQAGLSLQRDIMIDYRKTHDACLSDVKRGSSKACVTTPKLPDMLPAAHTAGLRIIGKTPPVPGVLFLANKNLPKNTREKLQAEIVSWQNKEQGRKIIKSLGFGPFEKVDEKTYQNMPRLEGEL